MFEGTSLVLSAVTSDPGGAADPLTDAWTVTGPDGFSRNVAGPTLSFTPNEAGEYDVTLAASDAR